MSSVARGFKNAARNPGRALAVIVILGLSLGLALCMALAREAVDGRIAEEKANVGTIVTVSPVGNGGGGFGFNIGGQGGQPAALNASTLAVVDSVTDHVVGVTHALTSAASSAGTNPQTNLQSGLTFGGFGGPGGPGGQRPTPPVLFVGTDNLSGFSSLVGGSLTLTSGSAIDPKVDAPVALLGPGLAAKNNLAVGSTFTFHNTTFTVSGIFSSGNFGAANNTVVLPLATAQRLTGRTGEASRAFVQVDSIDQLDATVSTLQARLGDNADVTSSQDAVASATAPLSSVSNIAFASFIGALGASVVILLLTLYMVVRERRREIGVLKAIGGSTRSIVAQFVTEGLAYTLMGAGAGLALALLAGNSVLGILIQGNSTSPSFGGGGPGGGGRVFAIQNSATQNLHTSIDATFLLLGVAGILAVAVLGSILPAARLASIRPSETLRGD